MEGVQTEEVFVSAYAEYEQYPGETDWKAFVIPYDVMLDSLVEYQQLVESGELTEQEALDGFLTDHSMMGEVTDSLGFKIADTREGRPPNVGF